MTTFPLRLTEELKAAATAQAARAGVSLNQDAVGGSCRRPG
jgi:predicted HicB family RNase H-like nuclease